MKITITEQHLDAAIAARKRTRFDLCRQCVVSQPLRAKRGFDSYSIGIANFNPPARRDKLHADPTTRNIELLFDNYDYKAIRALLPHKAEFTEL